MRLALSALAAFTLLLQPVLADTPISSLAGPGVSYSGGKLTTSPGAPGGAAQLDNQGTLSGATVVPQGGTTAQTLGSVAAAAVGAMNSSASNVASMPTARHNFGIGPDRKNIRDYGGYADALRGPAQYVTQGSALQLETFMTMHVTVTSSGGTSATISPAAAAPILNSSQLRITLPGAGASGASVTGLLTASDPTTGNITCTGCAFASETGIASVATAYAIDQGQSSLNGMDEGPTTVTTLTDSTGTAFGSQVVLPDAVMPTVTAVVSTEVQAGNEVCIQSPGQSEWCGIITNDNFKTGTTFQAAGLPGYSASAPVLSGTTATVYWGPFLFRPDDATACSKATGSAAPRSIEVPWAGTGTNSSTGALNPLETTVSARANPLNATLTAAPGTQITDTVTSGNTQGYLVTGCDDWPAYKVAVNRIYQRVSGQDQPYQLYFPADSFMASVSNSDQTDMTMVTQCGEGTVFWPSNGQVLYHGAAACGGGREIHSFPEASDLAPATALKHIASLAAGSTATLVTVGNSPIEPGTNQAGFISGRAAKVCGAFQRAYPLLKWRCIDRSIGGAQMPMLDPTSYTNGYSQLNIAGKNPWWYADYTKTWMSYVEALNPDVIDIGFSDQEAQAAYFGALLDIVNTTQTAVWKTAANVNPDIVLEPWPMQPVGLASQAGTNFAAAQQRAFAKACATPLANGGCPGLIDVSRMQSIVADGYDPEEQPMRRMMALPAYRGTNITAFPWSVKAAFPGLIGNIVLTDATATPSAGQLFTDAGGELDFTIGASNTSTAPALGFSFTNSTASSASTTLTVGYMAYTLRVGDTLAWSGGVPADVITAVSTSGCTASSCAGTVTLGTAATFPAGATILVQPPGPVQGYPGNIFRLYKDASSGNLAYRYDTVYFPTTGSDCSGTQGSLGISCGTQEVGYWHEGLQIAIPGGGTAQCPNPGGAANCAIGTISLVTNGSAGNQIVQFTGTTLANAVTNVQPIVFRTSIPYTVTSRAAETLNEASGSCSVTAGSSVSLELQVEYRGSKAEVSYCDTLGPGESILFNGPLERFDGPFAFTLDSPNHLTGGTIALSTIRAYNPAFAAPGASGQSGSPGSWFAVDPEYPVQAAKARIAGDIYGTCSSGPFGSYTSSVYGGMCASHQGQMGPMLLDDPILALMRP